MRRKNLAGWFAIPLVLLVMGIFAPQEVSAQTYFLHERMFLVNEGEPTDPEGILLLLDDASVDLNDHGIANKAPEKQNEVVNWVNSIVQLLRELGLMAPEETGS